MDRGQIIDDAFAGGLAKAQFLGSIASIAAGLVAVSSGLSAIGVLLFINDKWPEALIGTYEWHGLDVLLTVDVAILLASFFAVGAWIYRAHANFNLADGFSKEFTPGWAVVWFCIPIANLFMPFRAMKELWQGSHGLAPDREQTAAPLLWAWWLSWIAASLSSFGDTFNSLDVAGYAATSFSAVCVILIIRVINEAQPNMAISSTFE